MSTISTAGIINGQVVYAEHVLNIINALSGINNNEILIWGNTQNTGSFTVYGTSSFYGGPSLFSSSIYILPSALANVDSTRVLVQDPTTGLISYTTSSVLNSGSFSGSFFGDGSGLTGLVSSKWTGSNAISRLGDVTISGSLIVSSSMTGSTARFTGVGTSGTSVLQVRDNTNTNIFNVFDSGVTQIQGTILSVTASTFINGAVQVNASAGITVLGTSGGFGFLIQGNGGLGLGFGNLGLFGTPSKYIGTAGNENYTSNGNTLSGTALHFVTGSISKLAIGLASNDSSQARIIASSSLIVSGTLVDFKAPVIITGSTNGVNNFSASLLVNNNLNSTASILAVMDTGSVGINTSNPSGTLHVVTIRADANHPTLFLRGGGNTTGGITLKAVNSSNSNIISIGDNGTITGSATFAGSTNAEKVGYNWSFSPVPAGTPSGSIVGTLNNLVLRTFASAHYSASWIANRNQILSWGNGTTGSIPRVGAIDNLLVLGSNAGYTDIVSELVVSRNRLDLQNGLSAQATIRNLRLVTGEIRRDINPSSTAVYVDNLYLAYFDSTGSITPQFTSSNTYGVYIGNTTFGTQYSQSYGLYQQDTLARNYFGGRLGLNVNTPSGALHVVGSTYLSSSISTSASLYINTTTNDGNNPTSVAVINGVTSMLGSLRIGSAGATSNGGASISIRASVSNAYIRIDANDGSLLHYFRADGFIGLNKVLSPSASLHVSGGGIFSENLAVGMQTTGSAILQVRGSGTTTGTSLLVENSAQTQTLSILNNGTSSFEGNVYITASVGSRDPKLYVNSNFGNSILTSPSFSLAVNQGLRIASNGSIVTNPNQRIDLSHYTGLFLYPNNTTRFVNLNNSIIWDIGITINTGPETGNRVTYAARTQHVFPGGEFLLGSGSYNTQSISPAQAAQTQNGSDLYIRGGGTFFPGGAPVAGTNAGNLILVGGSVNRTDNNGFPGDVYIYGGQSYTSASYFGNVILAHNSQSIWGRVGIGIATPSASLHIKGVGTALSSSLRIENNIGSASLQILNNGTSSFNGTVIVTGSLIVSGSGISGSFSGSFVGDGSGLTGIAGGSSQWTGSGDISRLGNVGITGSLNVSSSASIQTLTIGLGTGEPTYRSLNTALGFGALGANTSGSGNTAVGYNTLNVNSIGGNNTAIGGGVLASNISGGNNTGVGNGTLANNISGSNNTGLGYSALGGNKSGSNNTGIGWGAFNATITGSGNTGVGYSVAISHLSGSFNTIIGAETLLNNLSGSGNTAIGFKAGYTNSGSGFSTFIGYHAGYNESGSNKLYIANNSSSTLIYGDFISGTLGLNNISPSASLHIMASTTQSFIPSSSNTSYVYRYESTGSTGTLPNKSFIQSKVLTTNGTLTPIFTQSLSSSTLLMWEGVILARRTNGALGSADESATYKLVASYINTGSLTTTLTPRNVTSSSLGQGSNWGIYFITSSNMLTLQVSGSASANITWHLNLNTYTLFN